ncbi:hypothetical protein F5Y13DRAFT_135235 [Hypoxylon sp. FL1857]|nr:hypothetical protein F5Y13DRAFT_135235 [Hypoxylon sp. FL1857]
MHRSSLCALWRRANALSGAMPLKYTFNCEVFYVMPVSAMSLLHVLGVSEGADVLYMSHIGLLLGNLLFAFFVPFVFYDVLRRKSVD